MTDNRVQVVRPDTAQDFLSQCESVLLKNPDLNHNIVQIVSLLQRHNHYYEKPYWFGIAESAGRVLGAAIYAEPDGLVLSTLPIIAVTPILQAFLVDMPFPPRIVGSPMCIGEALNYLRKLPDTRVRVSTTLSIGRLDRVARPTTLASGWLRQGNQSDLSLLWKWGREYSKERPALVEVGAFYEKKLEDGDLYFWVAGEPVVAITVSGRTMSGVRISSVYTATNHRDLGYASAAVSALCDLLLKRGHTFVVLTWRDDELCGNLYKNIGFYEIGKQQCLTNS